MVSIVLDGRTMLVGEQSLERVNGVLYFDIQFGGKYT